MPPQNTSLCHIDSFELKSPEKLQVQGRALCLPLFYLNTDRKLSHEKGTLPVPGRQPLYHQRLGTHGEMGLYKPIKITLMAHWPPDITPRHFSTVDCPDSEPLCLVISSRIYHSFVHMV